jgi:hypothetical protein
MCEKIKKNLHEMLWEKTNLMTPGNTPSIQLVATIQLYAAKQATKLYHIHYTNLIDIVDNSTTINA